MNARNVSTPKVFILLGFSDHPWLEMPLFIIVLAAYICTLVGNISIIVVSRVDPNLDSPMYFFLSNLSFLDLCFTTTTIPQLLLNLWGPDKSISYGGCVTQFYMFHFLGGHRMHPLSCDVLGSLHGHLQAFEVPSHHASATLYLPSGHGMAKWFGQLLASVIPHHPAATLWQQQGR